LLKLVFLPGFAVLVVAWLGLWASGTGVLFYSVETSVPKVRDCRYFIGVTIVKRTVLVADYCPVLNR